MSIPSCPHAASGCNYPEGECAGLCQALHFNTEKSPKREPVSIQATEKPVFVRFSHSVDGVMLTPDEFKALKDFAWMMDPRHTPEKQARPLDNAFKKLVIAASRAGQA